MQDATRKRRLTYPGNRVLLRGALFMAFCLVPPVNLLRRETYPDTPSALLALACALAYVFAGLTAGVLFADLWKRSLPVACSATLVRWTRVILAFAAILGLFLVTDGYRQGLLPVKGTADHAFMGFVYGVLASLLRFHQRASRTYLLVGALFLSYLAALAVYLHFRVHSPDGLIAAAGLALFIPFFLGIIFMQDISSEAEAVRSS